VRAFTGLKEFGWHEERKDKPNSVWSNPDKSGQPFQKKNHNEKLVNEGQRTGQKHLKNGSILAHGCPIF